MNGINKTILKIILVSAGLVAVSPLKAQTYCDGAVCDKLPDVNMLLFQFQYQYVDVLMDDMTRAGVTNSLTTIPGAAMGEDSTFHMGLTLPTGYKLRHDVWVTSPQYQSSAPVESAGVSFLPRVHGGYRFSDSKNDPSILSGLELHGSYMNYTHEESPSLQFHPDRMLSVQPEALLVMNEAGTSDGIPLNYKNAFSLGGGYRLNWNHVGFFARYPLMAGTGSGLFSWQGLTAGVGIMKDHFQVDALSDDSVTKMNLGSGQKLEWTNRTRLHYLADTNTVPVEVRSGVGVFGFMNFNLAVGAGYTQGSYRIESQMYGPVEVQSSGLFGQISNMVSKDNPGSSFLLMNLSRDRNPSWVTYFIKPGLEFDIFGFMLTFEGIITQNGADSFVISFQADI